MKNNRMDTLSVKIKSAAISTGNNTIIFKSSKGFKEIAK
jgi:hypothetical protein